MENKIISVTTGTWKYLLCQSMMQNPPFSPLWGQMDKTTKQKQILGEPGVQRRNGYWCDPPIPHSHAVKHGRAFPHVFMQAFPCTWHGWIHVCTCTYMHTHIHPHPFTQTPWVPQMFFTGSDLCPCSPVISGFGTYTHTLSRIAFLFFRVYTRQDIPGPMLFKQVSVEIR